MKNLATALSALALVGVLVLFGMKFSGNEPKEVKSAGTANGTEGMHGRIAYINIDTFQSKYEFFVNEKKALEDRQEKMSNELKRSQKKFQDDYMAAERKAQAGAMTEAERESTSRRLMQMSESLESRDAALTKQLLAQQDEFNNELRKRLDDYLEKYNKDKSFDYVLSYSKQISNILYANDALDITEEVIKGMNEEYRKEQSSSGKDTKKKNK